MKLLRWAVILISEAIWTYTWISYAVGAIYELLLQGGGSTGNLRKSW